MHNMSTVESYGVEATREYMSCLRSLDGELADIQNVTGPPRT